VNAQLTLEPSLNMLLLKSGKNLAATQTDFGPDGFRSSSPTCPARQSVDAPCPVDKGRDSIRLPFGSPGAVPPADSARISSALGYPCSDSQLLRALPCCSSDESVALTRRPAGDADQSHRDWMPQSFFVDTHSSTSISALR
jgi:hypothetical protein